LQAKVSQLEGELAEAREQLMKYQNNGSNGSKNPTGKDNHKEELIPMEAKKFAICHMLSLPPDSLTSSFRIILTSPCGSFLPNSHLITQRRTKWRV
jgi:hypothetical protein